MAKTNKKPVDYRVDPKVRVAGGEGARAARQDPEALLRRSVLSCLLFEDLAYQKGSDVAAEIVNLVHKNTLDTVAVLAIEARHVQKLRHVPLLLVREMSRHRQLDVFPGLVADTLYQVIQRPDDMNEFLAMYWSEGHTMLTNQVKKGLARAFNKFSAYQLAKYDRSDAVKLRDVLFMCHVKPQTAEQEILYKLIADGEPLPTPNTWETRLSAGQDKRTVFEDLITTGQIGALAFLRNLRGMADAGVPNSVIRHGFENLKPKWLLPVNYISAAKAAPQFEKEIEDIMLRGFAEVTKLPGLSIFIVDVSGSMQAKISERSQLSRMEVAATMAMVAESTCERCAIYATGTNHALVTRHNGIVRGSGFGLVEHIVNKSALELGGGGIYTRRVLEWVRARESEVPARIIVFSDSQDCDYGNKLPEPFGEANYIVDVSAHTHGINYKGIWTAEISGWSDHFIDYIAAMEGIDWSDPDEPTTSMTLLLPEG
jgi:60 kDa SS-A/Ro ribonucleoprotein